MSRKTHTKRSGCIEGQTTLYGYILRVGGKAPRVMIETVAGETLTCAVSLETARELGEHLYEFAEFYGVASWTPTTWDVQAFRVQSWKISSTKTPEQAMHELRVLVGRSFDGVDADAYVSLLRGEEEDM